MKVRIINNKTGQVKFVSEVVAKNARALRSYGFEIQDIKSDFIAAIDYHIKENKEIISNIVKPKRGRKPKTN